MIKFAIKAGIAGTAVYYVKEQGIWKSSDEAVETSKKIKSAVSPYLNEVKSQLPFKLPELPETENAAQFLKESWNHGVMATFAFLVKLPQYSKQYANKGINAVMANEEIKKFVNSFSASDTTAKK